MGRKVNPMPLSKEQVKAILNEAEKKDEFDYMFFLTLATTGRRIGELYGIQKKKLIDRKKVGSKEYYVDGKKIIADKTIPVYKKFNEWKFGVKVKDIDFERGVMKVVVLKRREYIQDETILPPELTRVMRAYIKGNQLKLEDHLFRKKGRGYRQLENKIKYYAKKAGIRTRIRTETGKYSLSIHSFRGYFITELLKKGRSRTYIKKLTGHKEEKSLSNYDHVVSNDFKEDVLADLKDMI